jgi:hypothetical protein
VGKTVTDEEGFGGGGLQRGPPHSWNWKLSGKIWAFCSKSCPKRRVESIEAAPTFLDHAPLGAACLPQGSKIGKLGFEAAFF